MDDRRTRDDVDSEPRAHRPSRAPVGPPPLSPRPPLTPRPPRPRPGIVEAEVVGEIEVRPPSALERAQPWILVALIAWIAARTAMRHDRLAEEYGDDAAAAFAVALAFGAAASAGVALIRFRGGTRTMVRWIAIAIAVVILGATYADGILEIPARHHNQQVLARLQQDVVAFQRSQLAQLEGEGGFLFQDRQLTRFVEILDKASGEAVGDMSVGLRLAAAGIRDARDAVASLNKSLRAFEAAGGLSPKGLDSVEDIDQRLVLLADVRRASQDVEAAANAIPNRLRAHVASGAGDNEVLVEMLGGLSQGLDQPAVREIRQLDRAVFEGGRRQLEVLKARWGSWEYDPAGDHVAFDAENDANTFDQLARDMQRAVEAQEQLQRQLLTPKKLR